MNIVYADPLVASTDVADRLQARRVELDELLRISDYVTVHAPLAMAAASNVNEYLAGKPPADVVS